MCTGVKLISFLPCLMLQVADNNMHRNVFFRDGSERTYTSLLEYL